MIEFKSPGAFALHLTKLAAAQPAVDEHVTKSMAEEVRATAAGMIGIYQDAVGPYPKWEELADSTEKEKQRLGYPLEAPLYRTGEMKKSIQASSDRNKAAVGSSDQKMVYHELGTLHIPPRPVFGPAAIHSAPRVRKIAARTVYAWLCGIGWRRPKKNLIG
ncbi:hypothetical protein FEE59_13850 [Herbaspirillum sp. RU 5E]|nr:hypothetical protein [Herbaspirillum sp. RU 5E]